MFRCYLSILLDTKSFFFLFLLDFVLPSTLASSRLTLNFGTICINILKLKSLFGNTGSNWTISYRGVCGQSISKCFDRLLCLINIISLPLPYPPHDSIQKIQKIQSCLFQKTYYCHSCQVDIFRIPADRNAATHAEKIRH